MPDTEYRLTTVDNPYDPFTQFQSWFMYDVERGYNTCGYLARVVNNAPYNSETDNNIDQEEINRAIDEIIKNDFLGIYKRVKHPS